MYYVLVGLVSLPRLDLTIFPLSLRSIFLRFGSFASIFKDSPYLDDFTATLLQ